MAPVAKSETEVKEEEPGTLGAVSLSLIICLPQY